MPSTTRVPLYSRHPLTVGKAEDHGLDATDGRWVVICEAHATVVNVRVQSDAYGVRSRDFCESCMAEEQAAAAPPPSAPRCPECRSTDLTWDPSYVTAIPPIGHAIPAPLLVLGCETCSATVHRLTLEDLADLLNKRKP